MVGARPIFVDVHPLTFNMNPGSLENKIIDAATCGIPRAVVPVDLFGNPYDHTEINRIARRYDLTVIEDGCQAFGSESTKKALNLGDHSFTSFYPTKPLGCYGDGGMIFTDDSKLAHKLKLMRKHGQHMKYDSDILGYNARLDALQAAVLLERFKAFEDEKNRRLKISGLYRSILMGAGLGSRLPQLHGILHQALFSVMCNGGEERSKLIGAFRSERISFDTCYPHPLHQVEVFREDLICFSYPNSESLSDRLIQLPMNPYLSDDEVEGVAGVVVETLKSGKEI
jgi:dTDP-4-amino-4,6-dideoxygalactose transaminase